MRGSDDDPAKKGERSEPDQTRDPRSARGNCAPCPIKPLARSLPAPWEEAPARSPKLENPSINRATVRFREAREKSAIAVVKHLGVSQEDTMEGICERRR